MAETLLSGRVKDVPLETFRGSVRFWFRGGDIAMGLLPREAGQSASPPRYWKWNRARGRWRITLADRDQKLVSESAEGASSVSWDDVLSYKPESRLAWRHGHSVYKRYREMSFHRAVQGARIIDQGEIGPRLLLVDPERRVIGWEWSEGAPAALSTSIETALEAAGRLHAISDITPGDLPQWTPERIRIHLRARLDAFAAWLPILLPGKSEFLERLAHDLRALNESIAALRPPERLLVIHGDLRRRNILIRPDAMPVLLDSDHVALGEREWDLALWPAEAALIDPTLGERQLDELRRLGGVEPHRLGVYCAAWKWLLALRSIEEGAS